MYKCYTVLGPAHQVKHTGDIQTYLICYSLQFDFNDSIQVVTRKELWLISSALVHVYRLRPDNGHGDEPYHPAGHLIWLFEDYIPGILSS